MRLPILAALLVGVSAAPAWAQSDTAPPEATFTGPRIELLAGYDNIDGDAEGLAAGGAAGFDLDVGGFILGVEGEYLGSRAEFDDVFQGEGEVAASFDVGRDLYVGGRVGVRATPTTLVYAKGGYTNTRVRFGVDDGADRFNIKADTDGYRIGAGVEQVVGTNTIGNAFVKLEYRYSNYGSFDFKGDFDDLEIDDDGLDVDRHQVLAGFGIRF